MPEAEKEFYLLSTPGLDNKELPKPTTTITHKNGIAVKLKQTGHVPNPSYGGWLISYTLKKGQFSITYYIDHQCCHDVFNQPIEPDLVPSEVKQILGKTLEEIQQLHPHWVFKKAKKR